MNAEEFMCFRDAYIALLKLPQGKARMDNQHILCHLRAIMAECLAIEEEDAQSHFEELARC